MRIRPYRSKDAASIKSWIRNETEHALWCANLFDYPLTTEALESKRAQMDDQTDGSLFTALDAKGAPIGFFAVMRADYTTNNAHLGFIIIAPDLRGAGLGMEMVRLAVHYCFNLLAVASVTLKVYDSNEKAHKCYKAIGFSDVSHNDKSLVFQGEKWGTWDMIITRRKALKRPSMY